jgi:hypothetical protein
MPDQPKKDIGKIFAEGTEIDEAIRRAVREAVLMHKQAGNPIFAMKNGKMVWIQPEEIDLDLC